MGEKRVEQYENRQREKPLGRPGVLKNTLAGGVYWLIRKALNLHSVGHLMCEEKIPGAPYIRVITGAC
jgi:hypothetical protein